MDVDITKNLKNKIGDEIMNLDVINQVPGSAIEAMKDMNAYNRELGEENENNNFEPQYDKLVYNPDDKTITGAYMITGESDKTIDVLNIIETEVFGSTFMDGSIPYSIKIGRAKLPKSQIEILGPVEGKEGLSYIKIPYWLYKKLSDKLRISRIEGDELLTITKRQYETGFPYEMSNKDVEKMFKIMSNEKNIERFDRFKKTKEENTEATSSGAAGQFSQPLFSTTKKEMEEKWSKKYKDSIDCDNPKGFSQKSHCQGKKKKIKEQESIKGGLASGKTLKDLAKMHSDGDETKMYKHLEGQLKQGIKVEMEHTDEISKAKEIAMDHLYEDPDYYTKLEKVEATEATSTSSAGQYLTPAFVAKNSKNWRGGKKPLYPGGKFVKIKDKCKKFPYCNQGDIKALKLFENEVIKKSIKSLSKKYGVNENVIKSILVHEYENHNFPQQTK